ncbi:ImmA/IrrE family metallo-endopeptidase [Glaciihabitans sp. UYNi722]|uniref:ImmA/IrrE family metallo-endopeptidase n=1 Tax=Glaciihabitans sp. UYNi722 TaxID=3156344 RepID=UPI0033955850
MYDPYDHAETLGIEVVHRRIRTANGLWFPEHNMIVIREGMKAVWDRSTLAHEIAHAALGHCDDRPKHEVMADRYAAENLIDVSELHEVRRWAPDSARLAHELGVTTRLLRVWLNVHQIAS